MTKVTIHIDVRKGKLDTEGRKMMSDRHGTIQEGKQIIQEKGRTGTMIIQ